MLDVMSRQLDVAKSQAGQKQVVQINVPPMPATPGQDMYESLVDTLNRIQSELEFRKREVTGSEYLRTRTV